MKVDQLHFLPTKKGFILKLPTTIDPFIVNSRHALPIVENLLKGMDLRQETIQKSSSKIKGRRLAKIKIEESVTALKSSDTQSLKEEHKAKCQKE